MIDPNNFLSYSVWLSIPIETRWKIARLFNFGANGVRETMDNRVISDGFVHKDLAVITKEKMSEITGVQSDDFYVLFNALVDYVDEKNNTTPDVQPEEQEEAKPVAEKKGGRQTKGRK